MTLSQLEVGNGSYLAQILSQLFLVHPVGQLVSCRRQSSSSKIFPSTLVGVSRRLSESCLWACQNVSSSLVVSPPKKAAPASAPTAAAATPTIATARTFVVKDYVPVPFTGEGGPQDILGGFRSREVEWEDARKNLDKCPHQTPAGALGSGPQAR